jgi:hypothetical protein
MKQHAIKVGTWTVDAAALRGITIEEAHILFPTIGKKRVETAWKEANPDYREKPTPKASADKGESKEK